MRIALVYGVLAVALAVPSMPAKAATKKAQAAQPAASAIEPQATAALQNMGRYLQTLQSFSVKANSATDHVLTTGQKIQLDTSLAMSVRRPDRLRVESKSDRRTREFYFDGKQLTIYSKAAGFYAKAPAPGTLKELTERIHARFGVDLPLADLFTWGTDPAQINKLTSASAIGLATLRGTPCEHYAFRQDGLDWQLWIQRGDQPLPRRLVLVTTSDAERPQYSVDLDWTIEPSIAESTFTFLPPQGAREIPWRQVVSAGGNP